MVVEELVAPLDTVNLRYQGEFEEYIFLLLSVAAAISLWFITAGSMRIVSFPPDSFYYYSQLPIYYWLGLFCTFTLLIFRNRTSGRIRTAMDVSFLTLLALYLFALPSLTYENARVLDSYQHEGNALALLMSQGWYNGPVWYSSQFPGAYTFFAELTNTCGIAPTDVIKYYPSILAILIGLFLYVIARTYSKNYAVVASSLILSGLWFQLHVSPQSLEILLYSGLLYLIVKALDDTTRRKLWSAITLAILPIFVLTHPETPLFVGIGLIIFVFLTPIVSIDQKNVVLRRNLHVLGPILFVLVATILIWWSTIAYAVFSTAENIVLSGLFHILGYTSSSSNLAVTLPSTPSQSYQVVTNLQKAESVIVWLTGLGMLFFARRFRTREYFFGGLFLAAVGTIPVALLANPDVLQRSFLFALFPFGLLLASLMEHPNIFRISHWSLTRFTGIGLIVLMVCFTIVMPLARYGTDPFDYLPQSSLSASNTAASLTSYSVLFPSIGQYGWRYYAPLHGYYGGLLYEQSNITGRQGGFVKIGTYTEYNLTFTNADSTASYVLISDYYQNLYVLRFGSTSAYYIDQKTNFENNTSMHFNLVYTTGTDRVYENKNLG